MKWYKALVLSVGVVWVYENNGMETPAPVGQASESSIKWDRSSGFDEGLTSTAAEDDARGNWYIKRKFLIDARGLYGQIKQRIPEVAATEKNFLDMRDTITQEIAQFYTEVGFEPQALDATLTATLQALEQERLKNMQLTEQERETYGHLEMAHKELTQVQQDIHVLFENEGAITRAIPVLSEQIGICEAYEQQAWDKYERISEVLNDHLAEQLYRDIQSYLNHINAIDGYIKGQFSEYFNQTLSMIRMQMATIKSALENLKKQGIVFESQATKELNEKQKSQQEKAQKQEQQGQSWLGKVLGFFKTAGYYMVYPFVFVGSQIARLWS